VTLERRRHSRRCWTEIISGPTRLPIGARTPLREASFYRLVRVEDGSTSEAIANFKGAFETPTTTLALRSFWKTARPRYSRWEDSMKQSPSMNVSCLNPNYPLSIPSGQAYERKGQPDQAPPHTSAFSRFWKDCGSDVPRSLPHEGWSAPVRARRLKRLASSTSSLRIQEMVGANTKPRSIPIVKPPAMFRITSPSAMQTQLRVPER